jgi:hypothetical protein
LCHTSEDKIEIEYQLFDKLNSNGIKIWYDKFVIKLDDINIVKEFELI